MCEVDGKPARGAAVVMADTTDALATLTAQMDDMVQRDSVRVAFCLASPANRRATARGGYDFGTFDRMVRGPGYELLLSKGTATYDVLSQSRSGSTFKASVRVVHAQGQTQVFDFGMSLQASSVVDDHPSLEPYQLRAGHAPVWRTDSVMLGRRLTARA